MSKLNTAFNKYSGIRNKVKMKSETCTIADENGKRVYHNVNGMWYNELMHEGEWSLYEISKEMWDQSRTKYIGTRPRTVVVHSRIYQHTRPVLRLEMPVMWCGKGDLDENECVPVTHTIETYDAVCHTELWPTDYEHCGQCNASIPDKFVTVWRLLNSDSMDRTR